MTDIARKLGEKWNALSDKQKQKYTDLSNQIKAEMEAGQGEVSYGF